MKDMSKEIPELKTVDCCLTCIFSNKELLDHKCEKFNMDIFLNSICEYFKQVEQNDE